MVVLWISDLLAKSIKLGFTSSDHCLAELLLVHRWHDRRRLLSAGGTGRDQ